jgi:O-antigen/teichoic acid export membrane protein
MISGTVTGIVVARAYGSAGRGEIALVTALYSNIGTIFTLGIEVAAVYLIGKRVESPDSVAATVRLLSFVLGLAGGGASVGLALALSHRFPESSEQLVLLSASAAAPLVASVAMQGHLIGVGRLAEVAWLNALRGVLTLFGVVTVVVIGTSPAVALMTYSLSEYVVLVATFAVSVRASSNSVVGSFSCRIARRLTTYGLSGHVGTILQGVNYRLDVILLGAIAPLTQVGRYSVAVVIIELLWVLPLILKNFVSQRIASSDTDRGTAVAIVTLKLCLGVSAVAGLGMALTAPLLVPVVFGPDFRPAVKLIWILIPGAISMAAYQNMMNDLVGRGHPRVKSLTAIVGCVATVSLDLIFIPRYGALGAAIGSSAAYCLTLAVTVPSYRRITGIPYGSWVPTRADAKAACGSLNLRRGGTPRGS